MIPTQAIGSQSAEFIPGIRAAQINGSRPAAWLRLGLLLSLLAFLLPACSKGNAIVGKWRGVDAADVTEFKADGTFHLGGGGDMAKGTYTYDGTTLALKLDGEMGKALGTMSTKLVVEGDTMKLTDPDSGKVEIYKRVK